MTRFRHTAARRSRFAAALAAALVAAAPVAFAQDGKDDALDRLLQGLEEKEKPVPAEGEGDTPAAPKPGEVAAEDEGLDRLLRKLGETTEEAAPSGEKPPAGRPGPGDKPEDAGAKPKSEKTEAGTLEGQDQELDDHLKKLLGRKEKEKDGEQGQQGQDGDSPLAEAIKKMAEAEERLGGKDTGEATRKTQGEIVKELDTILEKLRQAGGQQGQGQAKRLANRIEQSGGKGQQGQQQGESNNPNGDGKGVGAQQPKKPTLREAMAGRKDIWGDLPPHLREETENVFKTDLLPSKRDLIIRYYSSIARKGRSGSPQE